MKVLPEKEFIRRVYENSLAKGHTEEEAIKEATSLQAIHLIPEGSILVSRRATTGIRLHEVGHKVLGHTSKYSDIETGVRTTGDGIYDEILAEKYSYETRGKKLTYRLAIAPINMLVGAYR